MSGDQTHSVKRHLDVDAEGYDLQIRRFIPHYDEMLATGVELLAALAPASGHVLDLGGGTGALSAAVLDGLPGVRVTLLDVDRDMLGEARQRLAGYGDRVAFHEGSFLDPLPTADAVVASLALHHVHDLQTKIELYRAIHDTLSRGGVLLNLDAAVSDPHAAKRPCVRPLGGPDGRARNHRHAGARPLCCVGRRRPLLPARRRAGRAPRSGLRRGRVLLATRAVRDHLRAAREQIVPI